MEFNTFETVIPQSQGMPKAPKPSRTLPIATYQMARAVSDENSGRHEDEKGKATLGASTISPVMNTQVQKK